MLLLFYFLFLTLSQTFTPETETSPAYSPLHTTSTFLYRSTHRLSSGLSLNTTGGSV